MGSQAANSTAALVRKRRLAAGMTQFQLAAKAGVSLKTIEMLERGETKPLPSTLTVIDLALDGAEAA